MGYTRKLSAALLVLLVIPVTRQLFLSGNGPVQTTSAIDISKGFSFEFRTCSSGKLLYQGNSTSYFQVTLTSTNITSFSSLVFSWRHGDHKEHYILQSYFSLDRNSQVAVSFIVRIGQSPVFRVSSPIDVNKTISNYSSLMRIKDSGPLLLGPNGYTGCLFDGKGVNLSAALNLSKFQSNCTWADGFPCAEKVCPSGFAGQYCNKNINECGSHPCHSFATCIDGIDSYKCICGPQWTGPTCATFLGSLCNPSRCKNGGVCQESYDRNNYSCICPKGYTGRNCETISYPCTTNPCVNGGHCYNWTMPGAVFEYNCSCMEGFKGIHCELNIDDCSSHPCHRGVCIDAINNFTCNCSGSGFQGSRCADDINECITAMPCRNNGTCKNTYGGFECSCKIGYTGQVCESDVHECDKSPCFNNGTCRERVGHYQCDCPPGYTGQNCETNVNECKGVSCGNGTCVDLINGYSCGCLVGYTGKHCETNIDDCISSPCLNNGTCIDQVNGYQCQCLGAFNGTHCEIWNDLCSTSQCLNNATCILKNDTVAGFECNCTGTGHAGPLCQFVPGFCYPVNPCKRGQCNDFGSFYNCTCSSGYEGVNCSMDINECAASPCQYSSTCHNTPGSYYCTCTPYSTGRNCETDVVKCTPACQNGGVCQNRIGIRDVCLCPGGWMGNACERRIDYCATDKPFCGNGSCSNYYSNSENYAVCICNEGYTGSNCTIDLDECVLGYCKNSLFCTNSKGSYSCVCNPGFGGKNCSENINECASGPCRNNGTCVDEVNGYRCHCRYGFNGSNCQNDIDWCRSSPCTNNASCTDGIETYNCTCPKGYIGRNCEIDINECRSNPCLFGGTCIERSNLTALAINGKLTNDLKNSYANRHGYICLCKPGFMGVNCATNVNECQPNPCRNNATCTDLVNGYNCTCQPGYTGKNCSTNIDECASSPCQNNATCVDLVNRYSCNCKAKYTGVRCENAVNQCVVKDPCMNGGTCHQISTDYSCSCPVGFTGKNCSVNTTVEFDGNANWTLTSNARKIDFAFRTTLNKGLLLQFISPSGSLYLGLSSEGVVVAPETGSSSTYIINTVSDGAWHSITVLLDQKSFNFSIDGKHFRHASGIANIIQLHFGKANTSSSKISGSFPSYVGCVRDLKNEGKVMVPGQDGQLSGGKIGTCTWKKFCQKSPCVNGGACSDLWNKYTCQCNRRFFGSNCEKVYDAFTFGASPVIKPIPPPTSTTNSTSRRRRSVSSTGGNQTSFVLSVVNTTFNSESKISLSLRTRALNGILFLLSSNSPSSRTGSIQSYLTLQMINGALFFKFAHQSELKSQNTNQLVNDGVWHDINVDKQNITVDNIVIHSPGIASDIPARYFYVGGVDNASFFASALETSTQYIGCLQAISLNGATLTASPGTGGGSTHNVSSSNAQAGCNGTDVCGNNPCNNGGNCTDHWNAYSCTCPKGYAGDTCSLSGCSVRNPCPKDSMCFDLSSRNVTCVTPRTFNGSTSRAAYNILKVANASTLSFTLRTRSSTAIIMGSYSNNSHYVAIGLNQGRIELVYRSWSMSAESKITATRKVNDGAWYHIQFNTAISTTIAINDTLDATKSGNVFGENFKTLLGTSGITIGSIATPSLTSQFNNTVFVGCFAKFVIGNELISMNTSANVGLIDGCHSSNPCIHKPCGSGQCLDTFNNFRCVCPPYYTGEKCNTTHNVDCGFKPDLCHPSSSCVNLTSAQPRVFSMSGNDMFRCSCASGYSGYRCFTLVNLCTPNPCVNGTCEPLTGDYNCRCTSGYAGKNCSLNIDECASNPCQNGGSCTDGLNTYKCACTSSYTGDRCDKAVSSGNNSKEIGMWVGIGIAMLVVIIIIAVIAFKYCNTERGMQGTYSPSRQEKGQVEMASMPPIPPKERLI